MHSVTGLESGSPHSCYFSELLKLLSACSMTGQIICFMCIGVLEVWLSACFSVKGLTNAHIMPSVHWGRNNELAHSDDDSVVLSVHHRDVKSRHQMSESRKYLKLLIGNIS